jgi:hypothetical protein
MVVCQIVSSFSSSLQMKLYEQFLRPSAEQLDSTSHHFHELRCDIHALALN